MPSPQFTAVLKAIDTTNALDPRTITVDGTKQPFESVYATRMTETLAQLYPDAPDLLRIAARAQHIRRWQIPRDTYPKTRPGYQKWRLELRQLHARLVGEIMADNGYSSDDIDQVGGYLRKEKLKKDAQSQALENTVAVVFLAHYWDDFAARHPQYDDDKLIDIVAKTLRKMSSHGHSAALALDLPAAARHIVLAAVEREKDTLAKMAEREG
ncbi:MAG: DUF4202 domain-containing protein [Paracoccaceae bacterium]